MCASTAPTRDRSHQRGRAALGRLIARINAAKGGPVGWSIRALLAPGRCTTSRRATTGPSPLGRLGRVDGLGSPNGTPGRRLVRAERGDGVARKRLNSRDGRIRGRLARRERASVAAIRTTALWLPVASFRSLHLPRFRAEGMVSAHNSCLRSSM